MGDRLCGDKAQNNMTIALNLYLCTMNRMTYIIGVNAAEYMTEHIKILQMHQSSNEKLIASWLFPGQKYLPLLACPFMP